jgi:hypothetical protein
VTDAPAGAVVDLGLPLPETMPADQARARIAELKSDSAFIKKHLSGDHSTRETLARLHEFAYAPAPGSVTMGGPTVEAQRAEQADHLGTLSDLSADVLDHVRTGAAVSQNEYRMAVAKKESLFADAAWRAKYFAGSHEAKQQKLLLDVILSSPIKLGA